MITKREEEKNEKIIRGLLKLPPNRRCINCDNLGPQYVCTNFWTFVCMACSGIHREFTHRVKSVSMAKFTKEEVEALQCGGNQRARDLFLKEWDINRMRLPDSSNPDRIREFIIDVYVNKRYSGGKSSSKLSPEVEGPTNHQDIRRVSSYHSFSESPPYDYQYEDRRYGKQFGIPTRHSGSDRSQYLVKTSSAICSPGRLHGQVYENRFDTESSGSRMSDFSASSARNQFKYDVPSPNSRDAGHRSPRVYQSKDISVEDVRSPKPNARTMSDAPSGSFASNASEQDIFKMHTTKQTKISSPPLDLLSGFNNEPSFTSLFDQKPSTIPLSQPSSTNLFEEKGSSVLVPQNDGWAVFDVPKQSGCVATENTGASMSTLPSTETPKQSIDAPIPQQSDTDAQANPQTHATVLPSNMPPNGGEGGSIQNDSEWLAAQNFGPGEASSLTHGQWQLEDDNLVQQNIVQCSSSDSFQGSVLNTAAAGSEMWSSVVAYGPSISAPFQPLVGGFIPAPKSVNPFDLPYDSDSATTSSVSDMGSLQAALPDPQLPHYYYLTGLSQPWFPQYSLQTFHPLYEGQMNLQYMTGPGPIISFPNLHPQGHIAPVGGNPFA